ncbi:MAG: OmpA family protein [Deltaproteobacteria bacterium]|nr:OmpA family protein [Deltaproteobacteria bacterium]MBN2671530.1 OmpA family protein [Deltaproteobacteria bacterium]
MKKLFVFVALLVCVGCGGAQLTRGDILKHYDQVNQLSIEVADAEGKDGALLAPEGFAQAKELLDEAMDHAMDGEKDDANEKAQEGLKVIAKVRDHMKVAREEFEETLQTRERAILEGAEGLYVDEFAKADSELRDATSLIEENKVNKAREMRVELQEMYAALELRALKEGKKAAAEAAVKHAEELDADEWAPKTFHKAKEELKLVTSVLEADRTQKEKADAHANQTIWLAGRAIAITELAKMFDDGDYELEDILLWHQEQLEKVNQSLDAELPFDESDAKAVQALQNGITGLLKSIADMRAMIKQKEQEKEDLQKAHEKELAAVLEKHSEQLAKLHSMSESEISKIQREAAERLADAAAALDAESAKKKKYEYVGSLFMPSEAEVSRQDENILISVHGFDFPRRGTGIGSENFGLLDKIVSALNKFPDAQVEISGHTDSRGGKDRNFRLSLERAEAVVKFLTTIGGIEASRVRAKGMGADKPIAPNNTREGREKNRRIEVLIIVK